MRKFLLLLSCTAMVLMVACEGDDPTGEGGTLPQVTGLAIDWTASGGYDIVLNWTAVSGDVDGYNVYFRETSSGTWTEVGDVTGTTYTHTATAAGYYAVEAYKGDDTSEAVSAEVNSLPNIISTEYTIYDNYAASELPSGFFFGETSGTPMQASGGGHDIYAYDPETSPSVTYLYSGDVAPFDDGYHTEITYRESGNYGQAPESGYSTTLEIFEGDVIYCELENGVYVKMYINTVDGPVSGSGPNSTLVEFTYEYQVHEGVMLFTSNS